MAALPNLTQFFGGAPQAPPDGSDPDPLLDFSLPAPADDPDTWDHVTFTLSSGGGVVFILPPLGMGTVEVKVPPKVKLDNKSGAGKKKPRASKTGGDATKIKIKISAVAEAFPYILAASRAIQPGSGPWIVSHPKLDMAQIQQLEVEGWEDALGSKDGHGEIVWEITCQDIDPNAQAGAGGGNATSTPDSGNGQRGIVVNNFGGIPGNTVTFGADPNAKRVDPNTPHAAAQNQATNP